MPDSNRLGRTTRYGRKLYYDPVLGRFLTRDPAGYPDGPNNYLYCNNNPINHIDPLGLSAEQAEKVRNAKEVFDTFRDSVQSWSDYNPANKFAYSIGNQIVDSAVKRTADALDYATDSYAEAAYVGAGSVAGENAPYIGSLERLATGERINDETGRVEKTSTTQKVIDAVSLGLDVAAMVPGKGKAFSTLVDKVKGVFGKGAASVGDDVIAAGARAGGLGGNPFKGKTPTEIDKMFKTKGFTPKGADPMSGKGSYINPKTGRKYYLDPGGTWRKGTELPHVDVHRPSTSSLPKKKLPLGDKVDE